MYPYVIYPPAIKHGLGDRYPDILCFGGGGVGFRGGGFGVAINMQFLFFLDEMQTYHTYTHTV